MVLVDIGNYDLVEKEVLAAARRQREEQKKEKPGKTCSACGEELGRSAFSGKQWKARKVRRCDACASADRPVRGPAPARTAALTFEELDCQFRMESGAVAYYRHYHGVSPVRQCLQPLMKFEVSQAVMREVEKVHPAPDAIRRFIHEGLPPGGFAATAMAPFDEAFCG